MSVAVQADKAVVIYRLGSLGDTIVALPCFHAVAKAYPAHRRLVLTNFPVQSKAAPLESILGGSGLIHGALAYPVGTRSWRELWQLRHRLRALNADTLVYLTPARGLLAAWRDAVYFRLCGFKQIIGAPITADMQRNRPDAQTQHLESEALRLARCIKALAPIDLQSRANWDLRLTEAERAAGEKLTRQFAGPHYLAINMGGKVTKNDWGIENWIRLMDQLGTYMSGWGLLVVGAKEDAERAGLIAERWPGVTVDACGKLTPRESAAAMQGARFFVGHDSGPMHLAAAVGVPCVGLFGDNNPPAKWHPFGTQHQVVHRMAGVTTITVDDVIACIDRLKVQVLPH